MFSNRSQRTPKCGKNISDTLGCAWCATFLFLPHFDIICDLLLNRRTATWNLLVKHTWNSSIHPPPLYYWRCWLLAVCRTGSPSQGYCGTSLLCLNCIFAGSPPTFNDTSSQAHLPTMGFTSWQRSNFQCGEITKLLFQASALKTHMRFKLLFSSTLSGAWSYKPTFSLQLQIPL